MTSHGNGHSTIATLDDLGEFDDIIDVRTPAEFADDHLPGAINAPVLSNRERGVIGTIYRQESVFQANRLGAAMVARHIAEHLEDMFADRPKHWKPLIYCWRGGKRSGAMTTWFNLIGWKARQLQGGYKTWRRHVLDQLDHLPAALQFIVLAGPTGSGKTRLLQALEKAGAQTLDLEALACHRGSLLGALPDRKQPRQRGFETTLFEKLVTFDPAHPVFVEAESRAIGSLGLPAALIQQMRAGRCVRVLADLPLRIQFLLEDYRHLFNAPEQFQQLLQRLTKLHSRKTVKHWQALIDTDQRAQLFRELVEQHYDPAYRRSSNKNYTGLAEALPFAYDPTGSQQQAGELLRQLDLAGYAPASDSSTIQVFH